MEFTKSELRILRNAASSRPDRDLRFEWVGWIAVAFAVVTATVTIADQLTLNNFTSGLLLVTLVTMTALFVRFKIRALLLIRKIGPSEIAAQSLTSASSASLR
jgi:hypothetical protein